MAKGEITIKKGIKKSVFKGKTYPQNDFSMTLLKGGRKAKKPTLPNDVPQANKPPTDDSDSNNEAGE